jgi:hypothetical protein
MSVSINGTTGLITAGASSSGGGGVASNTALGGDALVANTTGANNTAIGNEALKTNTTADNNTAVGYQAGYTNATGTDNVYVGYQAGYSGTGNYNTAIGDTALKTATTDGSCAVGLSALRNTTTGVGNTAVGGLDAATYGAMTVNTTGSYNTALGSAALGKNTTASNNTAVGYQAGYSITTGAQNTLVGKEAGRGITTGSYNAFFGVGDSSNQGAGYLVTTGAYNTIIGGYSGNQGGLDIRTSNNNIVLSDGAGNVPLVCVGVDNAVWRLNGKAAGNYAGILQFCVDHSLKSEIYHNDNDDRLYIQNDTGGVYLASGGTSWTSNSDERLKNITGEIQNGIDKVCSLRAAEFTWKSDESAKPQVGLIAQDVLAVLPEAVQIPQEGSTNRDGSPAMMGISYTETIPLLVAAIKELKAEVDSLKAQLNK